MSNKWNIKPAYPIDSIPLVASYHASGCSAALDDISRRLNGDHKGLGKKSMLMLACPRQGKFIHRNEPISSYLQRMGADTLADCFLPVLACKLAESHKYCQKDVQLMKFVCEQKYLETDLLTLLVDGKIGKDGIRIDIDLTIRLIQESERLKEEMCKKIEVDRSVLTSTKQFTKLMKEAGYELEGCSKLYLEELLKSDKLNEEQRLLLQTRLDMNKSSISKLSKALAIRCGDHLHTQIICNQTQTGRYAGRGFQPHSLPGSKKSWDHYRKILAGEPLKNIEEVVGLIRNVIIPEEGYKLSVVDYSAIEARVLVWLVNDVVKIRGYEDGEDFYKKLASKIYNKEIKDITKAERQVGKILVLGCGYQMGETRLTESLAEQGAELQSKTPFELLNTFRDEYDLVAGYTVYLDGKPKMYLGKDLNDEYTGMQYQVRCEGAWKHLNKAFSDLIDMEITHYEGYHIVMDRIGDDIIMTLPSGRKMYYRNVRKLYFDQQIEEDNKDKTKAQKITAYRQDSNGDPIYSNGTIDIGYVAKKELKALKYKETMVYGTNVKTPTKMHGGMLLENIVQAVANCILRQALINVTRAGYKISLHVHDEIVTNVKNEAEHKHIEKLMVTMPKWADGIPLDVEGNIMTRYAKEAQPEDLALVDEVKAYDEAYFQNNKSLISDEEYDKKVAKIPVKLRQVGNDLKKGFKKVNHFKPMLSMAKVFDAEKLKFKANIFRSEEFLVEHKVDGMAVELRYVDGLYNMALTRGDGKIGDEVTEQMRSFVPPEIDTNSKEIHIRGEVYIETATFKEKFSNEYKNARNFVAGSVKNLDANITATRDLSYIAYDISYCEGLDRNSLNYTKVYAILKAFNFKTPNNIVTDIHNLVDAVELIRNESVEYATDGAVIKSAYTNVDSYGSSSTYYKDRFAYKFESQTAETTVQDIIFQVGRTGSITPVAILRPVELSGSTIAKVTLHNLTRFKELNIRIGDNVIIKKAGEIIPAIVRIKTEDRHNRGFYVNVFPPTLCPSCGSDLVEDVCIYEKCKVKVEAGIEHFCKVLGIKGLGKSLVAGLELGCIADLYRLDADELRKVKINGRLVGAKAKTIVANIQASKNCKVHTLIAAMGIKGISKTESFNHFRTADIGNFRTVHELNGAKLKSFEAFDFSQMLEIQALMDK